MFIIPASAVAKIMMAVTISLHPAAHHAPASYTVHQGDTLSAIAARNYGNSADWPAVWWVNRQQVRNPNLLLVGERLRLPEHRTSKQHVFKMRSCSQRHSISSRTFSSG